MDDGHHAAAQPASHYEYVVKVDNRDAAKIKQQGFAYMDLVDGWCSQKKAGFLIDLILKVEPERILEIGVWGGKSLIPMAYALKMNGHGMIYGIDPWSNEASLQEVVHPSNIAYWGRIDHEGVMNWLISKLFEFEFENQVRLIRSTSEDAPPIPNIDILHVDGNHSDKTSYLDVTKWVPFVNSGGWIIFDDMTWYENGVFTTARAVEWLNTHCIKIAEFKDNCVWGVWVKP